MFKRNTHGICIINAKTNNEYAYKQGQTHAKDRMMQLMLTRLVAQGRLSECLAANEETKEIDIFMKSMDFTRGAAEEVKSLDSQSLVFLQAYCDGINDYQNKHKRPLEFLISNYKPEPWKIEDSIIIVKIMSYMGLAQSQEDIEKIIIEKIQAGTNLEKLKSLYTPHLDNLDTKLYDKISKIKNYNSIVPEEIRFSKLIPKVIASNNWVISANLTKNKSSLQCNDPHLEINRLPAIWYETIADINGNKIKGVTMPGIPGLLMGRNSHISFGFTYGFMDMIDFFIEEVKDNHAMREDGNHIPIISEQKTIIQKKKQDHSFYIHRSDIGKIECPIHEEKLKDGFYFCRAWSGESINTVNSLICSLKFLDCKTTDDFCETAKNVTISCNWLASDTKGNIAYQQSGPLPIRKDSGLYPLEAANSDNHWKGIHPPSELGYISNPKKGYLATANQQISFPGKPLSINMPMSNYRYLRTKELIENTVPNDVNHMKKMQCDLYSKQAQLYLQLIKPYFENSTTGKILQNWDLNYDNKSIGATVFEDFYKELLKLVFTNEFLSISMWEYLESKTNILIDYFDRFDNIILSKDEMTHSLWFNEIKLEVFIKKAIAILEHKYKNKLPESWGSHRKVSMTNIFFAGKLPSFLPLDHGPISIQGNRATLCQGQVFKLHDRQSSFCPSYRYICDLKENHIHTSLAGGVSDRPLSKYYKNDVNAWLNFEYKII